MKKTKTTQQGSIASGSGSNPSETRRIVWQGTIYGEPASKSNSRRAVLFGKLPRFIKSKKALEYGKTFLDQASLIQPNVMPYEGDVSLTVRIFYRTRRPDLDASLIMDLLQGLAYANDRQCKEIHLYHGLDKVEPRAEIVVREVDRASTGMEGGA